MQTRGLKQRWAGLVLTIVVAAALALNQYPVMADMSAVGVDEMTNTYIVTNTQVSGLGSLHQAITDANANSGSRIHFNIPTTDPGYNPATGVWTIRPTHDDHLPDLTGGNTTINGYTQPGAAPAAAGTPAVIKIELDGTNAGFVFNDGLVLASDGNVIKGLAINRYPDACVEIRGGNNNTLQGNIVGLNAQGTDRFTDDCFWGVLVGGMHNLIGGDRPAHRNVLSGNEHAGVDIRGDDASHNVVSGNYVGTDVTGIVDLGNTRYGINVWGGKYNRVGGDLGGERNLISGNNLYGLYIAGSGVMSTTVQGNYVGTAFDGVTALPNGTGVRLGSGAMYTVVGGVSRRGERNVISGNHSLGIQLDNFGVHSETRNNQILGNFIGLAADQVTLLGNGGGITIHEGAQENVIGPSNIIAGSLFGNGIRVTDETTLGNIITQNRIFANDGDGIGLEGNTQGGIQAPTITGTAWGPVDNVIVSGTACPGCTVEVFMNEDLDGEGWRYVCTGTADAGGNFTASVQYLEALNLTATATDPVNGTSAFSAVYTSAVRGKAKGFLPAVLK